jgi:hypothetical protein
VNAKLDDLIEAALEEAVRTRAHETAFALAGILAARLTGDREGLGLLACAGTAVLDGKAAKGGTERHVASKFEFPSPSLN